MFTRVLAAATCRKVWLRVWSAPGVVVSVVLLRAPDSNLRSIQSLGAAVASVGDFDRDDGVCSSQVDPPPGVGLILCSVAAEPTAVE